MGTAGVVRVCFGLFLLSSTATAAMAQATSGAGPEAPRPSEADTGEIIVTAQKRAETVNTTPVAVSALSGDQLVAAGVSNPAALTSNVPNLQVHTVGVDGYFGMTVRGITNRTYTPNANPAVSSYIDGVYVDLPYGLTAALHDLNRIEVLRGPQGTLYGRNSTGGNLNIVTADPVGRFDASADVSYGNYNDVMARAMVNVPLSDTIAVRAAGMFHRSDGYFGTQGTTARNYGAADEYSGRLTFLFTPTENLTWRLSLESFLVQGTPGASIETGPDGRPTNDLSPYHQPYSSDPEPDNYLRSNSIRTRFDWGLGEGYTLSYIGGFQWLRQRYDWATTGQMGAPVRPSYQNHTSISSDSQYHEINLSIDTGRLKNIAGATYFKNSIDLDYWAKYQILGIYANSRDWLTHKKSWGLFNQTTLSVTDDLRLTGGVRYSRDRQTESAYDSVFCLIDGYPDLTVREAQFLTADSPGCFPPSTTPAGKGTFSKTTFKAGIDYDFAQDALAYASVTTGYKQGGAQPGLPAAFPSTYAPETVTNYEVGLKARLLDRSLNLRLAAFYADYTNIQVSQLISLSNQVTTATTNAGKARIYGLELESDWNITPDDRLSLFATWLDAKYTQYADAVDPRFGGAVIIPSLKGNYLPNAPKFSVRASYSHDFHLPNGGKLTPTASFFWQSKSYTNALNIDFYQVESYSKTDLRLSYIDPGQKWELSAFVFNLENEIVRTGDYSGSGIVFSDFGAPRTYGVRVAYRY